MDNQVSRWNFLTIFAVVNLVLWLGVAVAVGLIVSDGVDFGVETLLRQGQATAIAVWDQVSARSTEMTANPSPIAPGWPVAVQVEGIEPTETLAWPSTPSPMPSKESAKIEPEPGKASTDPKPSPRPTSSSASSSSGGSPTNTPAPQATAPVQPSPTPIDSPLLMADPAMGSLMSLDAEMGRSAVGRPVQIRYHEARLNQEVAALLADYPDLPYSDVQIDLQRDHIVLSGKVTVMGFDVGAEVLGQAVARDCQPQVAVQDIRIAGFLTPGFVKEGIKDLVLESMDWYPADSALCLEQIVLEDGRVTVYGSRR